MSVRLSILILMVMALIGCTATPQVGGSEASRRAPILGVVTDENLRVVEALPGGAAELAGIQVGDILLDLTWIPSPPPDSLPTPEPLPTAMVVTVPPDTTALDPSGTPITGSQVVTLPIPLPAPTIPPEEYMETATIPFTDTTRIRSLTGYRLPLKLRIEREGEILEVTVVPNSSVFRSVESPPTPLPETFYIY